MGERSKIEWTDATWNPVTGCTAVSEGCANCYARRMAYRFRGRCGYPTDDPFRVMIHPERLDQPLHWRKPRRVFVCSMSDLFHEELFDEGTYSQFGYDILGRMAECPQHTFIVLTKRPHLAATALAFMEQAYEQSNVDRLEGVRIGPLLDWPLPNLWLGVTAENQERADERTPVLLQIPAAVHFVSVEPMLGPVRGPWWGSQRFDPNLGAPIPQGRARCIERPGIDWIICGGETGPGARPMHPQWARDLRDQCKAAGVPFFFKQWGEWVIHRPRPAGDLGGDIRSGRLTIVHPSGESDAQVFERTHGHNTIPGSRFMERVGRKAAGRLLDGQLHEEVPG